MGIFPTKIFPIHILTGLVFNTLDLCTLFYTLYYAAFSHIRFHFLPFSFICRIQNLKDILFWDIPQFNPSSIWKYLGGFKSFTIIIIRYEGFYT